MPLLLSHPRCHRCVASGIFLFGLLTLVFGCGPNYKARGSVKGKVTLNKKPLTAGTVVFQNKDGLTASGTIDTQGNYAVNDAPIGECTITITVPEMPRDPTTKARMKGMPNVGGVSGSQNPQGGQSIPLMGEMPKDIVRIDSKYSKPETSGLTYTVEKGEQVHNIEL